MPPPHHPVPHPWIERIRIRGFRSLADVEFRPQPGPNVLIGANGSGKSNVAHFFNMLSWMLRSRHLARFVGWQGGADDQLHGGSETTGRLDAQIAMRTDGGRNDYRFALAHAHPDQLMFADEAFRYSRDDTAGDADWIHLGSGHREARIVEVGQSEGVSPGSATDATTARTITSLLRDCAAYQFDNTGDRSSFKKSWDAEDHVYMRTDGGNLAAILHRLEHEDVHRYELICRHIRRVLPSVVS